MWHKVFLRKAKASDARDVFILSNQQHVRRNSLNKEMIVWSEHIVWFNRVIAEKDTVFYVVVDDKDRFFGQIRFQIHDHQATVSISLDTTLRGKGYAGSLLSESMNNLLIERKDVHEIIAYILMDNRASIRLFEKVGFFLVGSEKGKLKYCYSRKEPVLCM